MDVTERGFPYLEVTASVRRKALLAYPTAIARTDALDASIPSLSPPHRAECVRLCRRGWRYFERFSGAQPVFALAADCGRSGLGILVRSPLSGSSESVAGERSHGRERLGMDCQSACIACSIGFGFL